jgi:RND family efflux transporter MFP subunit
MTIAAVRLTRLAACAGLLLAGGAWDAAAQSGSFFGKVVDLPNTVADVLSPATGRVISPRATPFTVGDRVQKGEPLAVIEHRLNLHDASHISNSRWDLLKIEMEARYVALQARIEREEAERLLGLGSVSAQRVQELKAAELVAKAEHEKQRILLLQLDEQIQASNPKRQPLTAPIEGEIALANFTQGQMIHEGAVLFRIVNRREVGVSARVPEADFQPWPVGTAARIRFDGLPGREFAGRLEQILPGVDPQSRTRDILFRVDNPGEMLRFGMIGQVEVQAR